MSTQNDSNFLDGDDILELTEVLELSTTFKEEENKEILLDKIEQDNNVEELENTGIDPIEPLEELVEDNVIDSNNEGDIEAIDSSEEILEASSEQELLELDSIQEEIKIEEEFSNISVDEPVLIEELPSIEEPALIEEVLSEEAPLEEIVEAEQPLTIQNVEENIAVDEEPLLEEFVSEDKVEDSQPIVEEPSLPSHALYEEQIAQLFFGYQAITSNLEELRESVLSKDLSAPEPSEDLEKVITELKEEVGALKSELSSLKEELEQYKAVQIEQVSQNTAFIQTQMDEKELDRRIATVAARMIREEIMPLIEEDSE